MERIQPKSKPKKFASYSLVLQVWILSPLGEPQKNIEH